MAKRKQNYKINHDIYAISIARDSIIWRIYILFKCNKKKDCLLSSDILFLLHYSQYF